MSKIKVSIVNQTTLRLEEKGEVGDLIDLQELEKVDTSYILELIKKNEDITYKELLKNEIEKFNSNKKIELIELENKLKVNQQNLLDKNAELISKIDLINKDKEVEIEKLKNEFSKQYEKEIIELENKLQNTYETNNLLIEKEKQSVKSLYESKLNAKEIELEKLKNEISKQYEKEIIELKNKLQMTHETNNLLIEKEKQSVISLYENKLNTKELELNTLKNHLSLQNQTYESKLNNQQKDSEINLIGVKQELNDIILKKDSEINQLRNQKSNLQIKMLGEELERWCNSEYENYALAGFDTCVWKKDNISVKDEFDQKGTKADYIFEIYTDEEKHSLLSTVICEMKNESPDSKNKTKNSDHYQKLEKDRIKKNAQYALLISELEWDTLNDTPIRKISGYENMYMVRPAYFITFLALITSITQKYQKLITEKLEQEEKFKDTQEILEEFEKFKTTYMDNPLLSLEKEVEKIKKEASTIYESSNKIIMYADTIISNKLIEMKNKIERFDIRKVTNKINKMNK